MKRDMDLIRSMLLKIEESTDGISCEDLMPADDPAEANRVIKHLKLMYDARLITGMDISSTMGWMILDIELTNYGHDFLADTRDPDIWDKTKERAKGVAGVGIGFLWEIAKAEIRAKLGL